MIFKFIGGKCRSIRLAKLVYMCLAAGSVVVLLLVLKLQSEYEKELPRERVGSGQGLPGKSVLNDSGAGDAVVSSQEAVLATKQTYRLVSINGSNYRITVSVSGKLGNQMFQYASLLGIAAMNGMTPFYISPLLANVFNLSHTHTWPSKNYRVVSEQHFSTYDPSFENLPSRNTLIMQYFQSWKYFRFIPNIITKEFVFSDRFRIAAERMINRYTVGFKKKLTRVGIHVRRGDMNFPFHLERGYNTAPVSYILKAMTYMRQKHTNTIFLLVTDDPGWCQNHLQAPDLVHVELASAEVHLALLASCDHVIMTVGTFGWWAGYLAGGEVVYYWDPAQMVHMPPLPADILHPEDFFLPGWIPLTAGDTSTQSTEGRTDSSV